MRRLFLNACLWILGFLILLSCSTFDVRNRLNDIESYIMDRPDSALAVLDTMDRSLLTTERLRAHHALLHAMALDKNYIDVTDDSIARVAVDYYSRKGPKKYEARALYYLGVAYYYQGTYDKAILEFTKAEKIASGCDSLYYGLTKLMQCNAYNATYNDIQELKYAQEAFIIFNDISEEYYTKVAKLSMSRAYYNIDEIAKSEEILLELLSDTTHNNILLSSMVTYAFTQVIKYQNFKEASDLYEKIFFEEDSSYMSNEDYWAWAYALYQLGQYDKSNNIIEQLDRDCNSGTGWYWKYLIEKSNRNNDKALYYLEKSIPSDNDKVIEALKQSLSSVQRDYYIYMSENAEYKAQNRTLIMIITVISAVLVIAAILWIVSVYIRKREEEKEQYLKYADEIHRQLIESKNENYPALKRKYLAMYQSRFDTIGALYEQYSLSHGRNNEEKAIYDRVVALVDEFRNGYQDVEGFESVINNDFDDIMADLRKDMPGFKEVDYAIFRFMLVGFDATVISHLLDMTMNAIYIRKSRMRHQIDKVNPLRKEEYLEILDSKSTFIVKS